MSDLNSTLRGDAIIGTIAQLYDRVFERFGERGLTRTARDLLAIGKNVVADADTIARPNWLLRLVTASIIGAGLFGLYQMLGFYKEFIGADTKFLEFAQGIEATLNIVLLSVLGIAFMVGLENRYKRERALKSLHMLRSIAHIIDMHQLTKDPQSILGGAKPTKSSPVRDLSPPEMLRYLDYCTEMLSLTGKLAALYAEKMRDEVVIGAVNDIEELTTGLSRKIWQKIVLIQSEESAAPPPRSA